MAGDKGFLIVAGTSGIFLIKRRVADYLRKGLGGEKIKDMPEISLHYLCLAGNALGKITRNITGDIGGKTIQDHIPGGKFGKPCLQLQTGKPHDSLRPAIKTDQADDSTAAAQIKDCTPRRQRGKMGGEDGINRKTIAVPMLQAVQSACKQGVTGVTTELVVRLDLISLNPPHLRQAGLLPHPQPTD